MEKINYNRDTGGSSTSYIRNNIPSNSGSDLFYPDKSTSQQKASNPNAQ